MMLSRVRFLLGSGFANLGNIPLKILTLWLLFLSFTWAGTPQPQRITGIIHPIIIPEIVSVEANGGVSSNDLSGDMTLQTLKETIGGATVITIVAM